MTKTANTMWGGRFAAGPDAIMEAINASIGFDQRLAAQDIAGSRAHAAIMSLLCAFINLTCQLVSALLSDYRLDVDVLRATFPIFFY